MKKVLSYGLAAALALGVTCAWFVYRTNSQWDIKMAQAKAQWDRERTDLETALTAAQARSSMATQTVTKIVTEKIPATSLYSPQAVLETLINLDPKQVVGSRNRTFRRIIINLQRLTECGSASLPIIAEFLKQNQDVYYSAGDINAVGDRYAVSATGSGAARTDFLVPPSLRLGLMEVLEQIGGSEAEASLAGVLATTGRAVEIAMVAQILEGMAPGKYRDQSIAAAKELLANPPSIQDPNRLDLNARSYLYQIFKMYGDTSYVANAQAQILTPDGKVDQTSLNYVSTMMATDSLKAMYDAYHDPRMTNAWEKHNLLKSALKYVGSEGQANEMFTEAVTDASMPANLRTFIVQSLAGGHRASTPNSPEVIASRIGLLENLKTASSEPGMLNAIKETQDQLQQLYHEKTAVLERIQEAAANLPPDADPIELELPPSEK